MHKPSTQRRDSQAVDGKPITSAINRLVLEVEQALNSVLKLYQYTEVAMSKPMSGFMNSLVV
jgi:hypothetical protein